MTAESEIRHGRHCVFDLHVHLVFVAKYRRRVFDGPAIERLREILAAGGVPAEGPVSGLVNSLKGVSSRLLRRDRRDIARRYWKGVLWSPSYFAASCGGAPIAIVRQYIEQQQRPD